MGISLFILCTCTLPKNVNILPPNLPLELLSRIPFATYFVMNGLTLFMMVADFLLRLYWKLSAC
jgi:hypothetical protein